MKKREIKFRAWIPNLSIMLYNITYYTNELIGMDIENLEDQLPDNYYLEDNIIFKKLSDDENDEVICSILVGEDWIWFEERQYYLMEFSGLQDKNGKDIYEGDIISLKNDNGHHVLAICEYGIARRIIDGNELDIPSFYFRVPAYDNKKTFPITNNYMGKHDLELFEIGGSIYENIDLIKD